MSYPPPGPPGYPPQHGYPPQQPYPPQPGIKFNILQNEQVQFISLFFPIYVFIQV